MLRRSWNKLSLLGIKTNQNNSLNKQIILSNQIALIGMSLVFILMLITIFINQNPLRASITGIGILFLLSILFFNHYGYTTFSRVGISFLLPLVILAITTFPKVLNTGIIPIVEYFQHRFLLIAALCVPAVLINHQQEKKYFWITVFLSFLFLQILDPIYNLLGVGPIQKYPEQVILKDYFLINIYDSVVWGIVFFSFLFLKEVNFKFEGILKESNKELSNLHKEVLTQNEELYQNKEEIKSQRDYIERKNSELNQINTKLTSNELVMKKAFKKLNENKKIIQEKNKSLEDRNRQINSSLNAAKIIQQAISPTEEKLQSFGDEFFVLYRPKDTVSGDFYWLKEFDKMKMLVVADCTGHGVAGAFMTLIGNSILDKLSPRINPENPAEVLEMLHNEVQSILKQDETGNNSGMDVSIIVWTKQEDNYKLTFAGAKLDIYYFCPISQVVKELKGTRKSIGGHQNKSVQFTNQQVFCKKGCILYVGSDGFEDQNNIKRKKFGRKRLYNLLSEMTLLPLATQKQKINQVLDEHMLNTDQRDDILYIGLKI